VLGKLRPPEPRSDRLAVPGVPLGYAADGLKETFRGFILEDIAGDR
jgi:hypothetical protein